MNELINKILLACTVLMLLTATQAQAQFNPALIGNTTAQGNDCFIITPNINNQSGAMWSPDPIDMRNDFIIEFRIFLGSNDANGADGLTFALKNNPTPVIGNLGGGMGYENIFNSIAVEFDTWQNGVLQDPFFDHIAIVSNGNNFHNSSFNLAGPVQASATSPNVEDGQEHDVRIEWDAATLTMSVFFDCVLRVSHTGDIVNQQLAGSNFAYFGFTGSTGGAANLQRVCFDYISFVDTFTLEDQALCLGDTLSTVDATVANALGYLWTPVTGVSNPTIANPTFSPTVTTTYTVDITNQCGNNIQESFTINVFSDSPVANPVADLAVCDDSTNNGLETFDLSQFNNAVLGVQNPTQFNVTYHNTQAAANAGTNPLPVNYTNTLACERIYARIQPVGGSPCYDTTSFNICVNLQAVANTVSDFVLCDDATNNGTASFDLSTKNPEVLGSQNPADFNVEYFTSQADADLGSVGGATALSSPFISGTATIFVRVEPVANKDCFDTASFDVFVTEQPVAGTVANLAICDDDTNDGLENVDLLQFDAAVLNGQTNPNFVITYHSSQAAADAGTGALPTNLVVNTGTTTIFARLVNSANTACAAVTSFDITLNLQAVANTVSDFVVCDDATNNGTASFDLSTKNPEVLGSQNPGDFNVEYFTSQADADLGSVGGATALSSPFISGTATIFVRVEPVANRDCFDTTSFDVVVTEQPVAGVAANQQGCDDPSNDGFAQFDFSTLDTSILNGLNPVNFSVTYHRSAADAASGTNAITFPFTNTSRRQTIYARLENNDNPDCFDTSSFLIEVFALPNIARQEPITVCEGEDVVLDAGPGFSSYLWSTGASTRTITVNQSGDYDVSVFNANGCENTTTITVLASELAVIERIVVEQFQVNTNQLTAIVSGSGNYTYSLDDFMYQESPQFANLYPGTYTIFVRDNSRCGTVSMTATIIGGPAYFTPNQDGYHDTWQVIGGDALQGAKIYIYDRFGKLLKQIDPQGAGWDGTFNGTPMPSSDYWYTVTLSDGTSFSGHFALKR